MAPVYVHIFFVYAYLLVLSYSKKNKLKYKTFLKVMSFV